MSPSQCRHSENKWPIDDLVTGHVMVKEFTCNWKIFWENYNDVCISRDIRNFATWCRSLDAAIWRERASELADWNSEPANPLKEGARTWSRDGAPAGPNFKGFLRRAESGTRLRDLDADDVRGGAPRLGSHGVAHAAGLPAPGTLCRMALSRKQH